MSDPSGATILSRNRAKWSTRQVSIGKPIRRAGRGQPRRGTLVSYLAPRFNGGEAQFLAHYHDQSYEVLTAEQAARALALHVMQSHSGPRSPAQKAAALAAALADA